MGTSARELDVLGARAWPSLEEILVDGWRLRFAGGVTKRANSVLPLAPEGAVRLDGGALAERVAVVERAYAERGLPPRFQITASSWPPELRAALSRRGYVESDRTVVMTASLSEVEIAPAGPGWRIVQRAVPSRAWFDAWWAVDGRGGTVAARIARSILARIEPSRIFVECHDDDEVVSVGLAVVDGEWGGVYCMATLPRVRRRGCAREVLRCLLASAASHGAKRAHLAVTEVNVAAQSLYRGSGFRASQRYSYFTLGGAGGGQNADVRRGHATVPLRSERWPGGGSTWRAAERDRSIQLDGEAFLTTTIMPPSSPLNGPPRRRDVRRRGTPRASSTLRCTRTG